MQFMYNTYVQLQACLESNLFIYIFFFLNVDYFNSKF